MQRGAKGASPLHDIYIVRAGISSTILQRFRFFRIAGVCQPILLACHRHPDSNY